jgi:hypothetical protein
MSGINQKSRGTLADDSVDTPGRLSILCRRSFAVKIGMRSIPHSEHDKTIHPGDHASEIYAFTSHRKRTEPVATAAAGGSDPCFTLAGANGCAISISRPRSTD